jgi:hypothetical protein
VRVVVGVLACALGLAGPARAGTLRVESAALVFPVPGQPGLLHIEALVVGLALDTRTMVRLDVGGSAHWVQLRPTSTDVLSIRSGEHGYSLTFNTRTRRLSADEVDVLARNPLPIELRQGAQVACTMIQFTETADRWMFTADRDAQFPCVMREAPLADRATIQVGRAEQVHFRLPLSGTRPDKGVRLVRVDERLKSVGKPVCELRDSGRKEDGDEHAGDGLYSCAATLNEPAAGPVRLRAEAEYGGAKVSSSTVTIDAIEAGAPVAPTGP